ncbi:kynurenine--oxoglutarate transaminase 1-like isoform X1 [Pezoporus flaviventris]|uniref:kynurenine--oxoglutarate transaminase 1-like isoform X1 n=2 Tax=Pezoporus TaxID=35539 RepID=UPI002AB1ADCF|nr:kynurenine--oxoglutarate transaminase 1-like isoform X1 [Pezoporus flaviventris]
MLRRARPSLRHFLLERKSSTGYSSYFSEAKMSRPVQSRRLEGVDKNIWVEFVKLAATYSTVNLGQGFPDFPPPNFLKEALVTALSGENSMLHQYTRAFGHPPLVKILAQLFEKLLGQDLDPMTNVMVTVGAYQALFCCFQAFVDEGDEVIIIEPFFDCYEPMVTMAGGTPVFVPLRPKAPENGKMMSSADWKLDSAELASKFNKRTKAIVLNSPNNPLGKVFSRGELELIADLCVKHDVLCISDEVYEWLVYDGKEHIRIASLPGMWDRTVIIGSAGKTFSATGWKVGWTVGPNRLLQHIRTVHQNSVYHCATAAQEAVAQGFQRELMLYGKPDSYFVQLPKELQKKRDWLVQSLDAAGMKPIIPEGTYFLLADISNFKSDVPDIPNSDEPYDSRFAKWMVKNKGLAAIPLSAFYCGAHKNNYSHFIRFCFAKGADRKVDWRRWKQERKAEKKKWKEMKLLKKLEKQRMRELEEKRAEKREEQREDRGRHYTLSVALPGSILNNAQSLELRTYLAGQIARACAIFCVDEIVVFDEHGEDVKSVEGDFEGIGRRGKACVQLARILQYLECPQYLRKSFFPKHEDLQFAGLLNPLDSPHHMRVDEDSQYREGVVLDRPTKAGRGSFVNCGMRKEVQIDRELNPGLRVTVRLEEPQKPEAKVRKGTVVSSQHPRTVSGLYWGYSVRLASCLSAVFSECPFKEGYDLSIGTSERGSSVDEATLPSFRHALVVFGGLEGLEAGVDVDPNLEVTDPSVLFDFYLNTCPSQGSRTIRTEEALLISLSALRPHIDEAVKTPVPAEGRETTDPAGS